MSLKHRYRCGIIGNCAFIAHIDESADVNWLCWPRFDSSFIFGNLLDSKRGGSFYIRPEGENFLSHQTYLQNTNVLVTEFHAADGKFRVIDFAPRFLQFERYFKPLMLCRKIELLEGHPRIRIVCQPRGEYGQTTPEVQVGSNHVRYSGLGAQVRLTANVPITYLVQEQPFVLNETRYLVMTWGAPLEAPLEATCEDFLRKTINYWRLWVLRCSIGNFFQDAVIRSALALKLHQYDDTGAIIASATTSLPEHPHSGRTWDYRYCWMRDAYYTLTALNNISQFEELELYASYLQNIATSEHGRYRPVYSISGDHNLTEKTLSLDGYLGNQPVRIGNQASLHIQNDVYGQMLVSILRFYVDRRFIGNHSLYSKKLIHHLLSCIESTMEEPDAGLWEFRNRAQKHCYTFLFHWAGSAAAERIGVASQNLEMVRLARKLKSLAANQIESAYNPTLQAYTQSVGGENLDASLLQLITMNYLEPQSPKTVAHLSRLEKELMTPEGLFFRYKHQDDLGKPESTFLVCSYWYVEALACMGRIDEAMSHFENLQQYGNHLGLLSEDVDASTGSQWGNFPQTYSHVGLMNAAFRITRKIDRPDFLIS